MRTPREEAIVLQDILNTFLARLDMSSEETVHELRKLILADTFTPHLETSLLLLIDMIETEGL